MKEKLKTLRSFLILATYALDCAQAIRGTPGMFIETEMQRINKLALTEIEKDSPDLLFINCLLLELEALAEANKNHKFRDFPEGGFTILESLN